MTEKFTKGDWSVEMVPCRNYSVSFPNITCNNGESLIVGEEGIFWYGNETYDVLVANANLISAAPDLYWALQSVMKHAVYDEEANDEVIAAVSSAHKALAKARGEEDSQP